jgi:hypothetical protein
MNIVPRVNTPLSAEEARGYFVPAYVEAFGHAPEPQELPLLLALIWIESGRGKSVQNNNPGNLSASDHYEGDAWRPPWFELDESSSPRNRDLHALMLEGKAPSAFRSYDSPAEGFRDHANHLKSTFPEVVSAAKTGDAEKFRAALSQKYSKDYGNPNTTVSLSALQKEFGGLPKALPPSAASPSPSHSSRPAPLPDLSLGSEGDAVELLRAVVLRLEPGAAVAQSGPFDSSLFTAVKVLQGALLCVPDGKVGAKTWGAIVRKLGEPKMTGY